MRPGQAFADVEQGGYSSYPVSSGGDFASGGMGAFAYAPSLAPVGTASAGNYDPGNCDQDAAALTYLGFPAGTPGGGNGQAADSASGSGAWNPQFQAAVRAFQASANLTQDGWIGPQTRSAILAAVSLKNNSQPAPAPNVVVPITPTVIDVVPVGPLPPGPAAPPKNDNTLLYVGIGLAAASLLATVYLIGRKKRAA